MAIKRAASAPAQTPVPRRAASFLTIVALLASGLGIAAGLQLASAASGNIDGAAFSDYNADGAIGSREPGIPGVEVVAVDGAGNRTTPFFTDTDGNYTIDLSLAAGDSLDGGPYRVEFAGWPAHLQETPVGADNGSSIQFASAADANISLGLATPSDYCHENPDIAAPCFVYAGIGNAANEAAVVSVGWDWADNNSRNNSNGPIDWQRDGDGNPAVETTLATIGEVGAVWGEAWDHDRNAIYVAAFVKRHTNLGPTGNPTTIYRIETQGTPDTADDVVGPWITVDAGATDPHTGAVDGWNKDFGSFDDVLTTGLGDIELTPDGTMLYAVDLGNRALVQIPIAANGDAGAMNSMNIPTNAGITNGYVNKSDCPTVDLRPAGLGISADGKVHVGTVCSAESTIADDDYGINPNQGRINGWTNDNTDLAAGDPRKLHAYVSVWDGDTAAPTFNTVLEFPLDGPRPCIAFNDSCKIGGDSEWRPWVDQYPYDRFDDAYSQPAVTDIGFDNGAMIVALIDRWGHQTGPDTRVIRPSDGREIAYSHPVAGGDIKRACAAGDGSYDIEGVGGCPVNAGSTGRSGGFAWTNAETGTFEKAFGVGDVELLCDAAPLTIGNRVWLDLDGDGAQDAGEMGINGVNVELIDTNGGTVAITTTNGTGHRAGSWSFAIEADTTYLLRFDAAAATGLPLNITAADLEVTGQQTGDSRTDNDATADGLILIAPRSAGTNDHTLDVGYTAIPDAPVLDIEKLVRDANGTGDMIDADPTGDGAGVAWYQAGAVIEYSIIVTNEGPAAITNIIVTDAVTPGCGDGPFDLGAGENRQWPCTHTTGTHTTGTVNSATATGGWQPPYGPEFGQTSTLEDTDDAVVRLITPAIGIVKTTATGTPYAAGAEVTYTYEVTNEGDTDLILGSPARISDDKCDTITDAAFHAAAGAPYNIGDTDADGILDVEADSKDWDDALGAETWQFFCVANVDRADLDIDAGGVVLDTLTSTVTVLGTPVESDGSSTGLGDVSRQDDETIFVVDPAIEIETQVHDPGTNVWRNGDALDGETGDDALPAKYYKDTVAEYRYVVTNTGNTRLMNPVIADSGAQVTDCSLPITVNMILELGESITVASDGSCHSESLGEPGDVLDNIGSVSATPVDEKDVPIAGTSNVKDSDPAAVEIVFARIFVNKVPGNQTLLEDGDAVWRFRVRNRSIGIDELENIQVTDVQSNGQGCNPTYWKGDTDTDDRLDSDEIWVYRCRITDVVDSGTDTATATGDVPLTEPTPADVKILTVAAEDTAAHSVGLIDLQKDVRITSEADWTDWVTARIGEPVEFRVVVSNPGDVPVIDVDLTDDQCTLTLDTLEGDLSGSAHEAAQLLVLSPGESWTFLCGHSNRVVGEITNTAALNGVLVDNPLTKDEPTAEADMTGTDPVPESISSAGYDTVDPKLSSAISIVFDGPYDADNEEGTRGSNDGILPILPVGEHATIVYTVRNDSDVRIYDVNVSLDVADDVSCSLFNGDPTDLLPHESASYFCDYFAATTGQTYRVNVTSDRAVAIDGHELGAVTTDADDTDSISYLVASVDLTKFVMDGEIPVDANTALESVAILAGVDVTWRLAVTNTGDVALASVGVDDYIDLDGDGTYDCTVPLGRIVGSGEVLAVGDTWTYECTTGSIVDNIENTAEVWAEAVRPNSEEKTGSWVSDNDPAFVRMISRASIGDQVWLDANGDGGQGTDEAGIAGIAVDLHDVDGNVVASTSTGEDGTYRFDDLTPGRYQLQFGVPDTYTVSPRNQGVDDAVDSDASATGFTPLTTLDPGENDLDWDMGLYEPASIGARVWLDRNANGIQEDDEVGLESLEVQLIDPATGPTIETTTTDANGNYGFIELAPGRYQVKVVVPATHHISPANSGAADATDSNIDADGLSHEVTLASGDADLTIDAGLYEPARVGSHAWLDTNADGFQDDDEAGLANVVVRLRDSRSEIVATATTDDAGAYRFIEFAPGDYQIEFVTPPGLEITLVDAANSDDFDSDDFDSDVSPTTGHTAIVALESGEIDLTWDAGFIVPLVVLSSPEINNNPQLAITGRTIYVLFGIAVLFIGLGGSIRILADRVRRREDFAV
ncbi:MAG: hypothetical protein ACI9MX_001388 [Candidatus Aldehydirespiratoraceae bacterium]|jgi:hypothetical protein